MRPAASPTPQQVNIQTDWHGSIGSGLRAMVWNYNLAVFFEEFISARSESAIHVLYRFCYDLHDNVHSHVACRCIRSFLGGSNPFT